MNEVSTTIKEFIVPIIKEIVDNPDDVNVDVSVSTKNVIVQVEVNDDDHGKVIGKKGRTIEALKVIASAVKNTKIPDDGRKVSLEILEDETKRFTNKNRRNQ